MSDAWRSLEGRRQSVEQVRENTTRPATAWALYQTRGVGEVVEPSVFPFGTSFVNLPVFAAGPTIDDDGDDLPNPVPRCTAGVYKWRQNAHGFYTGAWCWFTVDWSGTDLREVDDLRIIFTLSWQAVASKDFISSTGFPVNTLDL